MVFGIDIYTLLYMEGINNKVLLYSTGNYIQYLAITCHGKEYEKDIHTHNRITLLYNETP